MRDRVKTLFNYIVLGVPAENLPGSVVLSAELDFLQQGMAAAAPSMVSSYLYPYFIFRRY